MHLRAVTFSLEFFTRAQFDSNDPRLLEMVVLDRGPNCIENFCSLGLLLPAYYIVLADRDIAFSFCALRGVPVHRAVVFLMGWPTISLLRGIVFPAGSIS